MNISIFAPTQKDPSKSMQLYSDHLTKGLTVTKYAKIKKYSIEGTRIPFLKDILSKELYYPFYAWSKRADINHIADHSYGLLTLFLNKDRTVVTCHDLNALELKAQSSWLGRFRFLFNVKSMLLAKNIIVDSMSTKKILLKHFNYKGTIHLVYLGIDKKFWKKPILNKKKLRKKYNLPLSPIYLLHVGHSNPVKNIESILRVLKELPLKYTLIKVGPLTNSQEELIKQLSLEGRIYQFENLSQTKLIEIYNLVDLLLFPSLSEGFGFPVVEAMASRCPVVCSSNGSLPEIGGKACYYVKASSILNIKKGVIEVTNDDNLRKKMIRLGLEQSKKFTWPETIQSVIDVYDTITR